MSYCYTGLVIIAAFIVFKIYIHNETQRLVKKLRDKNQ